MADPTVYLAIRECPRHHYKSICVEGAESSGGVRLTPTKCCGRWDLVQRWKIDPVQVIADIEAEAEVDRG